jgi:uncharacterized protein with GYD domain
MATYIMLSKFTDQGIRSVKETTKRAEAFKEKVQKLGANIKDIYWTLGEYDVIATFEAPDAATATTVGLSLGAGGNVRTQTLAAFSANEMGQILSKI